MFSIQNPVKEPESFALIRFQDCDPFGHLNNARYLDYFLNARQDQIAQHYNLRTYEPDKAREGSWVVRKTQIAYLKPARVMEEVLIRTRLIHFNATSLVVEGLMFDKNGRHLKAIIWFEFVYISLATGKPLDHPDELMHLFQSVVIADDFEPNGFNRQVEIARRQHRSRVENQETTAVATA